MHIIIAKPAPHIAVVTLNRPEAANALNMALAGELAAAFSSLSDQRVIVLTGSGKSFCAGADLKERKGMDEKGWHAQHDAFEKALAAILSCPIPVIAAVNGAAFGGGLELALACDFIYASGTARFALTEATLGIMPGLGGDQTLPRAIGARRAHELMFTGKAFSAQEGLEWGIVNEVHPSEILLDRALACAGAIASNAPLAVKAIKASMKESLHLPLDKALPHSLKHYNRLLATHDRTEGINAWNEKRKAKFEGK